MWLEYLCPEPIQKFLADQHLLGMVNTYEDSECAVDRYFQQERRWSKKKGNAHICSSACADEGHGQESSVQAEQTNSWWSQGGKLEGDQSNNSEDDPTSWIPTIVGEVIAVIKGEGK